MARLQLRGETVGVVDPGTTSEMRNTTNEIDEIQQAEAEGDRQVKALQEKDAQEQRVLQFAQDATAYGGEIANGFAALVGSLEGAQIHGHKGEWDSSAPRRVGKHMVSYHSEAEFKKTHTDSGLDNVELDTVRSTPTTEQGKKLVLPTIQLGFSNDEDSTGDSVPHLNTIEFEIPKNFEEVDTGRTNEAGKSVKERQNYIQNLALLLGEDDALIKFLKASPVSDIATSSWLSRRITLEIQSKPGEPFRAKIRASSGGFMRDTEEAAYKLDTRHNEVKRHISSYYDRGDMSLTFDPDGFMDVGRSFFRAVEIMTPFTYSRTNAPKPY